MTVKRAKSAGQRRRKAARATTGKKTRAKPGGGGSLDRFVDAAAQALALSLDPAWKPMVKANLEVTLRLAGRFADFPLPDDAEPAPVFKA